MKIKLIAEGSTKRERKALRWGVSFLVGNVLFDAFGRADIFWKNVLRFRIDLSRVRHVVISHDDWDHIDALASLLRTQPGIKVYVCKKAGRPLKDLVRNNGGRLIGIDKHCRIARNIFSLGQMRADTGRGILYEQSLVVKSRNGFSVITGCAHPGIVRIAKRAKKIFGNKIYAVCGGFHMKDKLRKENQEIIAELLSLGVKKAVPMHCTGSQAARLFRKTYKQNCLFLREDGTLEL